MTTAVLRRPTAGDLLPFAPAARLGSAGSFTAAWSEEPILAWGADGPKLFVPERRDPHLDRHGRMLLPDPVRRELARLSRDGRRFGRLGVVHDLDPLGPVRACRMLLAAGSARCSDDVARTVLGPPPAYPGAASLASRIDRALAGVGTGLRAPVQRLLDPVLFGVDGPAGPGSAPHHDERATWFPLAVWWW